MTKKQPTLDELHAVREHGTINVNRLAALAMSAGYLLGGLFFVWNLLVVYAFSTMVNPEMPTAERRAEIVRRFLFGDGVHQVFLVTAAFAAALACFAFSGMKFWSTVTGKKQMPNALTIPVGSVVFSIIVLGAIYFVFS